jgi:hypothetical protein
MSLEEVLHEGNCLYRLVEDQVVASLSDLDELCLGASLFDRLYLRGRQAGTLLGTQE